MLRTLMVPVDESINEKYIQSYNVASQQLKDIKDCISARVGVTIELVAAPMKRVYAAVEARYESASNKAANIYLHHFDSDIRGGTTYPNLIQNLFMHEGQHLAKATRRIVSPQ